MRSQIVVIAGIGLQNPNLFKIDHLLRIKACEVGGGCVCVARKGQAVQRRQFAAREAISVPSRSSPFSDGPARPDGCYCCRTALVLVRLNRFGSCVTNTVRVRRCATVREMKEGPSSSAISLKLPQSRCRDHLHGEAVRDLRRTAFSSRCRPIAGSPRRRLVDRELKPQARQF